MMVPEVTETDYISAMTDRELMEHIARQLDRLMPLATFLENPPPMAAALFPSLGVEGDD
jgi:hypothetical protein